MGSDYMPGKAANLCDFGWGVVEFSTDNHERWGVSAPPQSLTEDLTDLGDAIDRCKAPDRNRIDTARKKKLQSAVEKGLRNYLQGKIMHNVDVTEEDRQIMGLPIRDAVSTPVGDPAGLVTATVKYLNTGAMEMHIAHMEDTPFDKRANYGVKIAYGLFALGIDEPLPTDEGMLKEHRFTRRKKEKFIFSKKDSRKTLCFCLRYENSKGIPGQWGPIMGAVII